MTYLKDALFYQQIPSKFLQNFEEEFLPGIRLNIAFPRLDDLQSNAYDGTHGFRQENHHGLKVAQLIDSRLQRKSKLTKKMLEPTEFLEFLLSAAIS
ncbi:hypothetical protein FC12_GL001077 [Lacticaseibacillus paracasei subsp. tolerans DSM 20258]|nr:hypothetical protein FC12_GL001077 [Lacticaseibacillus paracasei subsp. tolerans DSM 20258]